MKIIDSTEVDKRIDRIHNDFNKGLVSKAIDRCHGFIFEYPNNLEFRYKLGEIYYQIGQKDKAGQYWLLCDEKNDTIYETVSLYLESVNNSG